MNAEKFSFKEQNGIRYLESALFAAGEDIISGFSTRSGGVSKAPFSSLNLAFHTGDIPHKVKENRRRFFNTWKLKPERTISGNQVHGLRVHELTAKDIKNPGENGVVIPECDAIISDIKGFTLTAYSADCFLVGMFHREKKVIALVHAGWRGVLGKIVLQTLSKMEDTYGCNREKILTTIYPGICYNCFEVGSEVALDFIKDNSFNKDFLKEKEDGRFLLNLKGLILRQLLEGKVLSENTGAADCCTACNPGLFFSYRRDGGETGRMMALLGLK